MSWQRYQVLHSSIQRRLLKNQSIKSSSISVISGGILKGEKSHRVQRIRISPMEGIQSEATMLINTFVIE